MEVSPLKMDCYFAQTVDYSFKYVAIKLSFGFVGAPFDFLCATSWKPDGGSQGEICGVGRTTHQRR